jgi:hypothetical protein
MKNYNQKQTNAMVALAVITIILAGFLMIYGKWPEDLKDYGINVMSSILVGAFVFYIWKAASEVEKLEEREKLISKFISEVKEIGRENELSMIKAINDVLSIEGLKKVKVSDAFDKASSYIKNCDQIYVIGTTKQRQHNGTINYSIDRYLQSTIGRLQKKYKIDYRRMTSTLLEEGFQNHLSECFNLVKDSNHDFRVIMIDDFIPSYTYLIIDKSFLMVSLNQSELDYAAKYHSSFITEDTSIIERFRDHFRSVWKVESKSCTIIDNIDAFNYECKFMAQVSRQLSLIRESIKKLPSSDRLGNRHVLSELSQTASRLTGVANGLLKIDHNSANGNMSRLFNMYFQNISGIHTYKTITFLKFWADFYSQHNGIDIFLDNNFEALSKGAIVERTLVIPKNLQVTYDSLDKAKIIKMYSEIITQNLILQDKISNMQGHYKFRLLFSDKHQLYENKLYNFALISNDDESEVIIFDPSRDLPIQNTSISIFDTSVNRDNNVRMFDEVSIKKKMLNKIEKEWRNQELLQIHISFLLDLRISKVFLKRMFHEKTIGLNRLNQYDNLDNRNYE